MWTDAYRRRYKGATSVALKTGLRLLRDYLDRWQKPRNQYVLRVQEKRFVALG